MMRQQPRLDDFEAPDAADEEILPDVLLESGVPGMLAQGRDLDLDEESVGGSRLIRNTPAEEDEEDEKSSSIRSELPKHADPKAVDDWLKQVMTEGLHPLNVKPGSAARDMDAWAKDARFTFGDELMPKKAPKPAPPAKAVAVEERLAAPGGKRQHFSLEEDEPETLPDEACFDEWSEWNTCSATCWSNGAWQKRSRDRLANATTARSCSSGQMEQWKVCNRNVKCPIMDVAHAEENQDGDEALGCMVGDTVHCPTLTDYPLAETATCHGNMCCHHQSGTGETVSSVCPSAEAGWGDGKCNFPKQKDCTGGISGYRVRIERHDVSHPDTELGEEDPITLPKVPEFNHVQVQGASHDDNSVGHAGGGAGESGEESKPHTRAQHISTCTKHVCTEGWQVKLGLPDNFPCESSPCTEVECCELAFKHEAAATTATPCPTAEPVVMRVPVEKKMSTKEALALDSILAIVGVLFCIVGFYCGRKWTQFQHWMAERSEEQEREAEEEKAKQDGGAHGTPAAGAAHAAPAAHH